MGLCPTWSFGALRFGDSFSFGKAPTPPPTYTYMRSPVLVEAPPSPSNVALPPEPYDEELLEQWVAVANGGFARGDGLGDVTHEVSRMSSTTASDRAAIRKGKLKAAAARRARAAQPPHEYWVDHCENSQCAFAPGHAGLCSHQLVIGRRGGRSGRRVSPASALFDLNGSDDE